MLFFEGLARDILVASLSRFNGLTDVRVDHCINIKKLFDISDIVTATKLGPQYLSDTLIHIWESLRAKVGHRDTVTLRH